jgi:dUTP pyrophosphatase
MTELPVAVVRLPHAEGLALPAYASAGAAAMDLLAAVAEPLVLPPGGRAAIPTGLMVALPAGHELQVRPRSGHALNHGLLVANAPGTIDEDYRGEIKVILMNGGSEPFAVTRGMRIAQAVLAPVTRIVWREVAVLGTTARGSGGFGSTGV